MVKRSRAIIVGNGPSLLETQLERLDGETFACNRISQLYPYTDWRPDRYVRVETPNDDSPEDFWDDCWEHIRLGVTCHFPHWELVLGAPLNVQYFNSCHHYKYPAGHKKSPREWHLPMICDFGSVVGVMMQLAVLEGFEEIYLVGCDLGYPGDQPHFYDSSKEDRQPPSQAEANMLRMHENALKSCPVPIYNATIGGELELYPRVAIEELYA